LASTPSTGHRSAARRRRPAPTVGAPARPPRRGSVTVPPPRPPSHDTSVDYPPINVHVDEASEGGTTRADLRSAHLSPVPAVFSRESSRGDVWGPPRPTPLSRDSTRSDVFRSPPAAMSREASREHVHRAPPTPLSRGSTRSDVFLSPSAPLLSRESSREDVIGAHDVRGYRWALPPPAPPPQSLQRESTRNDVFRAQPSVVSMESLRWEDTAAHQPAARASDARVTSAPNDQSKGVSASTQQEPSVGGRNLALHKTQPWCNNTTYRRQIRHRRSALLRVTTCFGRPSLVFLASPPEETCRGPCGCRPRTTRRALMAQDQSFVGLTGRSHRHLHLRPLGGPWRRRPRGLSTL